MLLRVLWELVHVTVTVIIVGFVGMFGVVVVVVIVDVAIGFLRHG